MKEVDFTECEYINIYMRFVTYKQFCDQCYLIKFFYNSLSTNGKRFFKWYLYAQININGAQKDAIWNFLNDELAYEKLAKYKKR